MIGAVLAGHPAQLPQAAFQSFGQRLEAFRRADAHCLHIRVGQDQMEHKVGESNPTQTDAKIGHVGEVGLGDATRIVDLRKDHLLFRAVAHPPDGNLALQGAQLTLLVAPRVLLVEQGKEGGALQSGVALELSHNPAPVLLEGIGSGAIAAWLFELAGQIVQMLILASGNHAHSRSGCGLLLSAAFATFSFHQKYLRVALHDASYPGVMVGQLGGIGSSDKSNCRSTDCVSKVEQIRVETRTSLLPSLPLFFPSTLRLYVLQYAGP